MTKTMPKTIRFNLKPADTTGHRPAKSALRQPPKTRRPGTRSYTPAQIKQAEDHHTAGLNKQQAAALMGLSPNQIHYLWYVRPRQQQDAQQPLPTAPLHQVVPEPILGTGQHSATTVTYHGTKTRYRKAYIEQVKRCRQAGHTADAVADHFQTTAGIIRYIWYELA